MCDTDNTEQQWEELCHRCGLCCFEKIEDEKGTIFFTATPCRYLDVVSRECRIYERRFAVNPECVKLTPDLVKDLHWLHERLRIPFRPWRHAAAETQKVNSPLL